MFIHELSLYNFLFLLDNIKSFFVCFVLFFFVFFFFFVCVFFSISSFLFSLLFFSSFLPSSPNKHSRKKISILWPLFHYLPGEINFSEEQWDAYQAANQAFADALSRIIKDGDSVWIHDYHLMLLPQMLRKLVSDKNIKIGFFLHTPFPSSEIYRLLDICF